MKRKYGGQRRSLKRRRITKSRGSRGIGNDAVYGRSVGTNKGGSKLRRLARRIKSINATPFPDNGYNQFNTTSSTSTCRLLTFQVEGNSVVAATLNGTKWHQNCCWTLSLAGISSALVQRCEVIIVRTRKTIGSLIQAIDGPQELDNSLLTDSTNKSNFKILK